MARHIAVAGKGGTGKTTFAALLIRYLVEKKKGSILAVDADPNANLNEALGVKVDTVIADILDATKNPRAIPAGMSKDMFIQYQLAQALVETRDFDLLTMGRPQGPGCYCYPNDLLRKHLETLSASYDYMVIDSEAGLEHISRRVIQNVKDLFVISDASVRGIRSAGRVQELVQELQLAIPNMYLIVTKTTGDQGPLQEEIERTGLPLGGTIPYDEQVVAFDTYGKPLFELPAEAPAVLAVSDILSRCPI
ncbi:Nickel insertion ATPase/GTPase (CO dehydrogenase maturation factor), CooC type [Moorella glycerini]|uniref:Septum site-determining protein MinD n=1 Tax=Neomoorella stamsii TaxID=1266720 RepID=A0A9X7J240_9FIRM|nr:MULTISPECIES: carbon monoxide dehydrogenase accessory protein CooC [Moorella]PRR71365.1 Septum site-determining protein MinD [Moorella stamsii]CEP66611.1 Nickel insertion ATPase/GTPase (CO dehydrogenase maturation factor), CooC type [Moorella glycerini]CEP68573.1 Nickel insertion ATPase/GTPase (CO dehydrogenase maturation factor), CooC type [Moorella glycerini]